MLKIYAFFNVMPIFKARFAAGAFLAASLFLSVPSFVNAQDTETFTYNILREGKQIGLYRFEVLKNNQKMTINATMDIEVKVLFLTAYKARHTRVENYENAVLQTVEGSANYNDKPYTFNYNAKTGLLVHNGEETHLQNLVVMLTPYIPKFEKQSINLTEKGKPSLATFTDKGIVKKKAGIKLKPFRHIQMNDGTVRDLFFTPEGILETLSYEKDRATISFVRRD